MPTQKPKATLKPDNPAQSKRFIETAREIGVDESPEAFERVFTATVLPTRGKREKSAGHRHRDSESDT